MKILLVKEDIDKDFLEVNPRFKTNKVIRDIYNKFSGKESSCRAWALYFMLDPKSSLFKDSIESREEKVREFILSPNDVHFDIDHLVMEYRDIYEKENLTFLEQSLIVQQELLLEIERACRDIRIEGEKGVIIGNLQAKQKILSDSSKSLKEVKKLYEDFLAEKRKAEDEESYGGKGISFRDKR